MEWRRAVLVKPSQYKLEKWHYDVKKSSLIRPFLFRKDIIFSKKRALVFKKNWIEAPNCFQKNLSKIFKLGQKQLLFT